MKMTKHPLGTLVETDVLVIGSGASGCGAALGARDQGLDVVLMDKGKLESSGCIGGGNDHYMAVLDEPGEAHDTVEDLIKFYAKPLNGWSPAMLQNGWYAHMKYFLDVLGKAGVQFSKKADGTYLRTQGFGQPGRWWVHIANGMTIKRAMARIVRDAGINTLDNVMAVKILTDNGKACGALGWNVRTGEFVLVRAKTVVSAQGRSATRGTDNSTHNPFNVWMYPYNTSAGVVLGYDLFAHMLNTNEDMMKMARMVAYDEGLPVVPNPGILSPQAFVDELFNDRFPNEYLGDTNLRLAVDVSQMVGIRFGETVKAYVEKYGDASRLTAIPLGIAGWLRYLLAVDDAGNHYELAPDPMKEELTEQLKDIVVGHPETFKDQLKPILSNERLFFTDLYKDGVGEKIETMFREMIAGPGAVKATIHKYVK